MNRNGYRSDAEGCGKLLREIIERRRPKIWRHLTDEGPYVEWLATWAFHWAGKALAAERAHEVA